MTKLISRRAFLSLTSASVSLLAVPALANAPTRSLRPVPRPSAASKLLQDPAEVLIDTARLGGTVGFSVADMATGDVLEERDPTLGQPPASVAKALSAAYALDVLGEDFRFETSVLVTGSVVEGTLQGDLVLVGGGDPTLDTTGLAELADLVSAAGITKVAGSLKTYGGALPQLWDIDASQPDHVGYNPSISGLNLNFNRVHFEWQQAGSGYAVTMQARSEAYRPDVQVAQMQVMSRTVPVYTYLDEGGKDNWTVAKGALGKGGARWLPVRKPEIYAGETFQTLLRAKGVTVGAPEVTPDLPDGTTVATVFSDPLPDILRGMLKWSTNLTAEIVGLMASKTRLNAVPESLAASAEQMNLWARDAWGLQSIALVDHSGLGEASRISARDMMKSLRSLRLSSNLKPLLKEFRMLDKKGRVAKDHPLTVRAKTGTLNFVSGLAGFVDLPDGRELVFAIFAADLERRAALLEAERERPPGGREWNRRAKRLQQGLIERWGAVYSG